MIFFVGLIDENVPDHMGSINHPKYTMKVNKMQILT